MNLAMKLRQLAGPGLLALATIPSMESVADAQAAHATATAHAPSGAGALPHLPNANNGGSGRSQGHGPQTSGAKKPGTPKTPATPPGYSQSVKAWHAPVGTAPGRDAQGRQLLSLFAINTRERLDLPAQNDEGAFSASDLDRAARFLRDPRTSAMHPIEPRLLARIYRVQRHFEVAELRVISGYRLPKPGGRSNHGRGRALDLVVPGSTDEEVAKVAREQGYCGVGIYPTSGFVHIDVRDRSYFWVDTSGPGAKRRERSILPDLANRADDLAKHRGDTPVRPYRVLLDVDAAGAKSAADVDDSGNDHDEDEDGSL